MPKGMSQMPNRFADGWTYGELSNSFAERSFRCSIDCAQYLDSITHRRTVLANDDCRNSCSNSYEKWRKTNEKRCNRVKSRFFSESSSDLTFAKKNSVRDVEFSRSRTGICLWSWRPGSRRAPWVPTIGNSWPLLVQAQLKSADRVRHLLKNLLKVLSGFFPKFRSYSV